MTKMKLLKRFPSEIKLVSWFIESGRLADGRGFAVIPASISGVLTSSGEGTS